MNYAFPRRSGSATCLRLSKKKVSLLAALLLSFAPWAQAADVNVAPGLGTLNAAVIAAEDGDTLFLQDGSYRMLGMTISKSLTFKAQTNNNPIIVPENSNSGTHRSVVMGNANSEISIAFVGVTLSAIQFSTAAGEDIDLSIVESNLSGYPSGITDNVGALANLTLIGNSMSGSHWVFNADRMVIAGNTFNLPALNTFSGITLTPRDVSHFIGNEINSATLFRTNMLTLSGELHFVIANRVHSDISTGGSIQDGQFVMVNVNGNVHSVIKNNLFGYVLPAEHQPDPLDPLTASLGVNRVLVLDIATTSKTTVFENNIIDYGMDADDITFKTDSEVIESDSAITVRNNVVVNTTRDLVGFTNPDAETNSVVEFNLCDNVTADTCGADDDVTGDALFVDNVDYMAATGSAAIDAGDPDGVFNDADGTRNDLGVYGGTFPLDQYDVQRTDGRLEPYLYPLFEPNKAVSSDGKLNVRVVGLARSK